MEFDKKKFEKDVMNIMTIYAKSFVKTGTKLVREQAEVDIDKFYRDRIPKYYKRTNNLRNHSIQSWYSNKGNGSYYGYVQIMSDKMLPYGNDIRDTFLSGWNLNENYEIYLSRKKEENEGRTNTAQIAEDAWMEGVHGLKKLPHMSPSPYTLLEKYYKSGAYKKEAHKNAFEDVVNSKYYMLTIK